jgi:hypothetical protein
MHVRHTLTSYLHLCSPPTNLHLRMFEEALDYTTYETEYEVLGTKRPFTNCLRHTLTSYIYL